MNKPTSMVAILALAALLSAPLLAGCSTNPATGETEIVIISTEQEIAMGQEAGPVFEAEMGGRVPDQRLQLYVQMVGRKVAAVSDRPMPYEFTLVSSDVPNAFALPGGKIYISAGLMSKMSNERQLAAVLGHEVAHVAARHNVQGIQRQLGMSVLAKVAGAIVGGSAGAAAEAATEVSGAVLNLRYSRGAESQADEIGLRYMTAGGYNPWGMVEMLAVLKGLSEGESSKFQNFFQTHPLTSERIEEARRIVKARYGSYSKDAPDPNVGRFIEMRDLLARSTGG